MQKTAIRRRLLFRTMVREKWMPRRADVGLTSEFRASVDHRLSCFEFVWRLRYVGT